MIIENTKLITTGAAGFVATEVIHRSLSNPSVYHSYCTCMSLCVSALKYWPRYRLYKASKCRSR